jgi:hypothetical protein
MKELVDVFYYDYVLYRLAELYFTDNKDKAIPYYQKIAQKLLIKLRGDRIAFDAEVGLKFAYIKVCDLLLVLDRCDGHTDLCCCKTHYTQFIETCFEYLSKIQEEYTHLGEDQVFTNLRRTVATLCVFVFPSLGHFNKSKNAPCVLELVTAPKSCIGSIETEEEFSSERERFLSRIPAGPTEDESALSFFCSKLADVFSSFKPPLLQYFSTCEVMRLKRIYPLSLEKVSGLPTSKGGYKKQILSDYAELCDSVSRTRRSYIAPKTEGERLEWDAKV